MGFNPFPGKALHSSRANRCSGTSGNGAAARRALDSVIIATDDMRIAEAAFAWGAEVA